MKNILLLVILACSQLMNAQQADVRQSIDTFFEGLHAKDTVKIQSVCSRDMIMQTISENAKGSKLITDNTAEFFKSIASIPATLKIEEKLSGYDIKIDGTMAHAWTPYEFYVDGKLSHRGVNSFQLFKDNGVWKIVYIIDTRRK